MRLQGVKRVVLSFAMVSMMAATYGHASTTNVTSWDFEGYSLGTVIVDTGGVGVAGWTGSAFTAGSNAAVIVAASPAAPPNGYPLPASAHTKAMAISGEVRVEFSNAVPNAIASCTNVYIDTLIQPGHLSFTPEFPAAQMALFFNTNGNPVVAHSNYKNNCGDTPDRNWTVIEHLNFASNDWVRVTVEIDYLSSRNHSLVGDISATDHFFRLWLNGELITNSMAYMMIDFPFADCNGVTTLPGSNNTYFLCADSGSPTDPGDGTNNNWYFSGIEFSGAGQVDDTWVTSGNLISSEVPPCPYPPDYCAWIAMFPASDTDPDGDDDGDGATNWEEYIAGTDPTDDQDVFAVIAIDILSGSNCIWWVATTNSGVFSDFMMFRSTNLTPPVVWDLIGSNITRDASGVTSFYDSVVPTNVPSYYRPSLPTNAP
jgi:hypothetical protein